MKANTNLNADQAHALKFAEHNLELGYSVTIVQQQPAGQHRHAVLLLNLPHAQLFEGAGTASTDMDEGDASEGETHAE